MWPERHKWLKQTKLKSLITKIMSFASSNCFINIIFFAQSKQCQVLATSWKKYYFFVQTKICTFDSGFKVRNPKQMHKTKKIALHLKDRKLSKMYFTFFLLQNRRLCNTKLLSKNFWGKKISQFKYNLKFEPTKLPRFLLDLNSNFFNVSFGYSSYLRNVLGDILILLVLESRKFGFFE